MPHTGNADAALQFSSCSSEVGIAVGAITIVLLIVTVFAVSVVLCLWR